MDINVSGRMVHMNISLVEVKSLNTVTDVALTCISSKLIWMLLFILNELYEGGSTHTHLEGPINGACCFTIVNVYTTK
jgi:hypothetical protein